MHKKISNKATIITIILIVETVFSQIPVCPTIGNSINIKSAISVDGNLKIKTIAAVSTAQWQSPKIGMVANIQISGWTSINGSLIELIVVVGNKFSAIVKDQKGVIAVSELSGTAYVFAQKDYTNPYFNIELIGLVDTFQTVHITFALWQRGYNNLLQNKCQSVCEINKGVQFFSGTTGQINPNQFICFDKILVAISYTLILSFMI